MFPVMFLRSDSIVEEKGPFSVDLASIISSGSLYFCGAKFQANRKKRRYKFLLRASHSTNVVVATRARRNGAVFPSEVGKFSLSFPRVSAARLRWALLVFADDQLRLQKDRGQGARRGEPGSAAKARRLVALAA